MFMFRSTGMMEYGHSTNRFTGKFAGFSKHINSPTKILHFSNLDESSKEEVRFYGAADPCGTMR